MTKKWLWGACLLVFLLGWTPATGEPETCSVHGTMFWNDDDVSGDGGGFEPLANVLIVLEEIVPVDPLTYVEGMPLDPLPGGFVDIQVTDLAGEYCFMNVPVRPVPPGQANYYNCVVSVVRETLPRALGQSIEFGSGPPGTGLQIPPRVPVSVAPSTPSAADIHASVFSGEPGHPAFGLVAGGVFTDVGACDGIRDAGDAGEEGVPVMLEYWRDGLVDDARTRVTETFEGGSFGFSGALPDYPFFIDWDFLRVTVDLEGDGFDASDPIADIFPSDIGYVVDGNSLVPGSLYVKDTVDLDFELGCVPVVMGGQVFLDGPSPNGVLDAGEKLLSGFEVAIHGVPGLPPLEPLHTVSSDAYGSYVSEGLEDGIYAAYVRTRPGGAPLVTPGRTVRIIRGGESQFGADIALIDSTPPTVAYDDMEIECMDPAGVSTAGLGAPDGLSDDFYAPGEITLTYSPSLLIGCGTHTVTCTARDGSGNEGTATFTVAVVDTTPPTLDEATATPSTLWPPNKRMVDVNVSVDASDACDPSPTCKIVSIASNKGASPGGSKKNHDADWIITGDLTAQLRAERNGGGERVYTITVACADACGNTTTTQVLVRVPASQGKGASKSAPKKK